MKKILFSWVILAGVFFTLSAQTLPVPPPSPSVTIKQQFGTSFIELIYSRPGVKGRTIFGDVVSYGKVWRTGANSATTIEFGDEVMIQGAKIAKGKYGLITIPNENNWEVIITKDLTVTDASDYKPENDVVKFSVSPKKINDRIENFVIEVQDIKPTEATIEIKWDRTVVAFKVTTEIDAKIMTAIEKEMGRDRRPFHTAAVYYYENGKDLNQALTWENKALENNPKAYWVMLQKAKIQMKLKAYPDALKTAQEAKATAEAEKDDNYVKNSVKLMEEIKSQPDYSDAPAPAGKGKK